eukprot:CAMPEP_0206539616 /NCGR_PEP_ID=MMETSP0325_2-20121206/8529_1 /ASSEMBLY_ACC=CAM_ASM_000347 /TAXON_ID=2866 /ORGANISM="Crypthecodinium cohnii, Strain Seligo" /LENGTH=350 /DNA_ID=CAMNT_0054037209 /DNA_START=233 /DNA_END=1281 /DNA_ORIENTATION=+
MDVGHFANYLGDPRHHLLGMDVETRPPWLPWPEKPLEAPPTKQRPRRPQSATGNLGASLGSSWGSSRGGGRTGLSARPASAGCQRGISAGAANRYALAQRAREDEFDELDEGRGIRLREGRPPELATDLELRLASALGLRKCRHIPGLPENATICENPENCLWRFLARAAIEHIAGEGSPDLELPALIAKVQTELHNLRGKSRKDDLALANIRDLSAEEMRELSDIRALKLRVERLESENQDLQQANTDLGALLQRQGEESKRQMEKIYELEASLESASKRQKKLQKDIEEGEHRLELARLLNEDHLKGHKENQHLLMLERNENTILQEALQVAMASKKKKKKKAAAAAG